MRIVAGLIFLPPNPILNLEFILKDPLRKRESQVDNLKKNVFTVQLLSNRST